MTSLMELQAVQDRMEENCCRRLLEWCMRSSLWGDGLEKELDVRTEILEALVKRDWMLKEPGVGWGEQQDTAEKD